MNKNRIIITGGGGSGKDYLKRIFVNKGYKPSISCTTRPIREGEVDGKDYWFIDQPRFDAYVKYNMFYEYKEFRGWYYGTLLSDFDNSNIFIMTPYSISELSKEIRDSSLIIYLDINENIREQRLTKRNDADSIKRRLLADKEMFEFFTDYDIRIDNPLF